MEKLSEKMTQPGVWIGNFCIRPFDDDQFVLENKGGEALVIERKHLEPVLRDLFARFY